MPGAPHRRDLEKDYDAMRVMIFGEVPSFASIIETLARLENEINRRDVNAGAPLATMNLDHFEGDCRT